jgi:predicted transcriptional regulator
MKTLSLKLDDEVFEETDRIAGKLNIARNRYINEALEAYNMLISRKLLKEKLRRESNQVSKTSMEVLNELEKITDDL